jgi:hypothetical protein
MRGVGNLELDYRIFVSVFPLDGFLTVSCGTAQELVPVAHVLKNNEAVIFGM